MNAAQSHVSLLLLAVMGVPWLIDRAFTWLEDSAAYGRRLERRVAEAAWASRRTPYRGEGWAGCVFEGNTWTTPTYVEPTGTRVYASPGV